jgi:hypothetical protein
MNSAENPPMNTSKLPTNSKWGGRRPGAGRKPDLDSIRGTLRQATEGRARGKKWTHSFTKWEVECDNYLSEHAHVLVIWLSMADDGTGSVLRTLLSRHAAYQIAHLEKSVQPDVLLLAYPNKLQKACELHGNSPSEMMRDWARVCGYLLDHGQMPPGV